MVCVVRESHEQVHQLVAYATHFVANTENSSVNESGGGAGKSICGGAAMGAALPLRLRRGWGAVP